MEPGRLDATARQLAASTSRGQAIKILAGSLFGTAFFLKGTGRAFADNPGHPVTPAQPCKKDPDCPVGSTCANGVCRVTCSCDDLEARIARLEQICANGCGGGGGSTPCTSAASCPQPTSSCKQATCTGGVCGMTNVVAGTTCSGGVCDGAGNCVTCLNASDCPASGPCATSVCVAGTCSTANSAAGTACSGGVCDGAGACVQCTSIANCPSGSSTCNGNTLTRLTPICSSGTCGFTMTQQSCAPYACANGVCATTCQTNADCAVGFVCSGNRCVAA